MRPKSGSGSFGQRPLCAAGLFGLLGCLVVCLISPPLSSPLSLLPLLPPPLREAKNNNNNNAATTQPRASQICSRTAPTRVGCFSKPKDNHTGLHTTGTATERRINCRPFINIGHPTKTTEPLRFGTREESARRAGLSSPLPPRALPLRTAPRSFCSLCPSWELRRARPSSHHPIAALSLFLLKY